MSNEVITGAEVDRSRRAGIVFVIASALVFVVFATVTLHERGPSRHTLRVIAPEEVGPGARFPVVARVFVHQGESLVHEIETGVVEVELLRGEASIWRGELGRSPGPYFGAEITAPGSLGRFELVFRHGAAIARQALNVVGRPVSATLAPLPPELRAEISRRGAASDLAVDVRVGSGVCVPEHACEIMVLDEGDLESARLDALSGLRVSPGVERGASVTSWSGEVRGLEARVEVEVTRGEDRAELEVSLPVASGGVAVRGPRRLFRRGDSITLETLSLNEGLHVHTHHREGVLCAIGASTERFTLHDLLPGVHRVQVGGDLFSPTSLEKSAAFVFVVASAEEPARSLLERAATRELEALELSDRFVERLLAEPDELSARAIMARLETYRAQPPPAITGGDLGYGESGEDVSTARVLGAAVIVLLGLWVAITSIRAGRRESKAAREHARREGESVWVRPARGAELRLGGLLFLGYLLAAAVLLSRFWIFG